ncbi:MAG: hypothetical protein R3Y67_04630 [Eubacteriales bacterium]
MKIIQKINKEHLPHIILITLALVLCFIAAYKLINWNTRMTGELPGDDDAIWSPVQSEDYLAMVNPLYLEGREDDGVTTIVMIGDETLGTYDNGKTIAELLEEETGATIYTCYFPDTYVTTSTDTMDTENLLDVFSLTWVCNAISANNFSILENALALYPETNPIYQESLDVVSSIDFETVDVITIMYGPRDYLESRLITDIMNEASFGSYSGSHLCAIAAIKDAYPHIQIVISSPMFCVFEDEDGSLLGSDLTNTGYGKLSDYMVAAKYISVQTSVTYLDNFYGMPANADNYEDYLIDGMYPNEESRTLIAERIANVLQSSDTGDVD